MKLLQQAKSESETEQQSLSFADARFKCGDKTANECFRLSPEHD